MTEALLLAAATCAAATVALGCGEEVSKPSGPVVSAHVTSDFGRDEISSQDDAPLAEHDTVLRLLRGFNEVTTIFDGQAIESIDGQYLQELPYLKGWVQNVNGIETDVDPGKYELFDGDVVQADLRYWHVTLDVRATVGAFPETFTRGVFGKRFPVELVCAPPSSRACREVRAKFAEAGVAVDGTPPPGERPPKGQPQRARVLVGTWDNWRGRTWPARIDRGPRYSGVFARFTPAGDGLELLDWEARPIRTEGPGTGLVAAMRPTEEDITWFVTGVDEEGVERAAEALGDDDLREAFAVAVTSDGVERLPLEPVEPLTGEPLE